MIRYKPRPTRHTRTYIIEDSIVARIDCLAQQHSVFQSSVVGLLLKRALDEVEAGRWPLKAQPVAYDATWDD